MVDDESFCKVYDFENVTLVAPMLSGQESERADMTGQYLMLQSATGYSALNRK